MKKAGFLLFVFGSVFALAGCTIGEQESHKIPEQIVDESKYEIKTEEGVYLGIFNEKFVDIEVAGERKMFNLPEDVKKTISKMEEETRITFKYSLTKKGEYEIKEIQSLYAEKTASQEEETDKEDEEEKIDEKGNEEELLVEYAGNEEKKSATSQEGNGFHMLVLEDYDLKGNEIRKREAQAKIELDVNEEIKRERWKAAGDLKEYGNFKEKKGGNNEFTFYVETENEYREISVRTINGKTVRVTKVIPLENQSKSEAEIEAMLNTLE